MSRGGGAGVGQAIHPLDGAPDVVGIDVLVVIARLDHLTCEDSRDLVVQSRVVVLIPGYDEQAVVRLSPLGVTAHVGLQPGHR